MRYYKPRHGDSVSPHQLELTSESRVLKLILSRKEKQMLLTQTFRTDVEKNFRDKQFTGKTFDGYVKGSKSLVGHFMDIDATVTSFEESYDGWCNTTIDLQATHTNNSRLR